MEDDQRTWTRSGPKKSPASEGELEPSPPSQEARRAEDGELLKTFGEGDLVNGRYRILRFIAGGGAAEVYEAEDEELDHRVALKALRRDPTRRRAIERFKRETNLARQVTHPNVCRIYEFGHHGDDVLYLTMELLEGDTLLDRIRSRGPLSPREALPLVRQMAEGLDAAHRAGVVHRDLKCGNVMLVPAEVPGGYRAVITDFGLARDMTGEDAGPRVTMQDTLVGTPAYMSPEQVEAGAITSAADIYAFGVVIYEMLTGEYPFRGETSLATAVMRLKEKPAPPSVHVPGLDERWEAVVLRCLERRPEDRFQSARQVVEALEGEAAVRRADETLEQPRPALGRLARAGVLAAAALALAASAGWWIASRREPPPLDGSTAPASRPSIALLSFQNLSRQEAFQWLATALAELLATEIGASEDVRVIPGENVARMKIELGLGEYAALTTESLARVGDILGAGMVVVGTYVVAGAAQEKEIRLDVHVRRTSDGETVARISKRGTEAGVLDLVDRTGQSLRSALGLRSLTPAAAETVRAIQPANPETARLYARGLEKLRLYNAKEALELLEAAAAGDPDNPLIRTALSSAWAALGYMPRARREARAAVENAGGLSFRERLWVEAFYQDLAGDPKKAVDHYGSLWDHYPDDDEYGLRLAHAQARISEGEAALATVGWLRSRSSAAKNDPRVDLAEAEAARSLGRFSDERDLAAAAAEKSESLGARLLLARAREVEADAFRELGEPEKAMAAYDEARAIYRSANNQGAVARVLISQARIPRYQGRFAEARKLVEEALTVARGIGDQGSIRLALSTLALLLREEGKLSEALEMCELELESVREIGEVQIVQVSMTSLGVVRREMGDLAGAKAEFEEALELSRAAGNLWSQAINHNLLGEVLMRRGRLDEAQRHFESALELNKQARVPRGDAYYLASLGDVDLAAGRLEEARKKHEEAYSIRESLDEKTNMAFSRVSLATVAIEQGRLDEAARMAVEAADEFRSERKPDSEGWALATLARARLLQGRAAEAQGLADRAAELLEGSENRGLALLVTLRTAEIDAAAGRGEEARRKLTRVLDGAGALGFVDLSLEAGGLLGRIEAKSDRKVGEARMEAVAKEAEERGFLLLAEQIRAGTPL